MPLNAALDQITDPRVHSSALRLATTKIPGRVIRAIPFVNASEAVTISLDQLTAETGWPRQQLRDSKFDEDRKSYSTAVDRALKEDREGDIASETIQQMRTALSRMKAKLQEPFPSADRALFGEAESYLKSLYAMTRMLERPDCEKIIAELDSIKETTLGSLLGFMHTFNLRFGRANTPEQRAAYEQLYPVVAGKHRDRVVERRGPRLGTIKIRTKNKSTATPALRRRMPPDFFSRMRFDRLEGPHKYNPKPSK